MGEFMKLQLISIGNSMGIRIPKALLQQCNFERSVTAKIVDGCLVLSSHKSQRDGWDDAFKKAATPGTINDTAKLLDLGPDKTDFDDGEWEW